MRRLRWAVVAVTALAGAGLAALVQWWPHSQECAGSSAPCPSGRVAGTVSAAGIIGGLLAGAALAAVVMLLNDLERRRRDRSG